MPRVSVIIPTHNRRTWVCEAVESVLVQTCAPHQVIVVDDGSTDGSAVELAGFGDRIQLSHQNHAGVSAARNRGARLATGDWFAFLDSDDLWMRRKLEVQTAFHAANPMIRMSHTDEIWLRDGVRVNPCAHHRKPGDDVFSASLRHCRISPSTVMIDRRLFEEVGGFDEGLAVCEDYDLWLRIAARERIGLVPHPTVIRRGGHADQLSRQYWGMDRFRIAALQRVLATESLAEAQRTAVVDTLVQKTRVLAAGARRRGRAEEADRYAAIAGLYRKPPEAAFPE